jgi:hypothetical protein
MSACALRRWGPGTNCTRPADTPAAREAEQKLQAMMAERARQDQALWGTPPEQTEAEPAPKTQKIGTTKR